MNTSVSETFVTWYKIRNNGQHCSKFSIWTKGAECFLFEARVSCAIPFESRVASKWEQQPWVFSLVCTVQAESAGESSKQEGLDHGDLVNETVLSPAAVRVVISGYWLYLLKEKINTEK